MKYINTNTGTIDYDPSSKNQRQEENMLLPLNSHEIVDSEDDSKHLWMKKSKPINFHPIK